MIKIKKHVILFASVVSFFVLILDAETAVSGGKEGVALCLGSVIPSLFPFIFVSQIMLPRLKNCTYAFLRPFGKLLKMESGTESIFLLGILGGYPMGAQCVTDQYKRGALSKEQAQRYLGFCNNAGPAFIFGLVCALFEEPSVLWSLWGIHVISAIITAQLLPVKMRASVCEISRTEQTKANYLVKSMQIMGRIVGWVILFRIIISYCNKWLFFSLRAPMQALFSGFLELTNGIHCLKSLENTGLRFILASVILALGGLCVAMQTYSATNGLGLGFYFPGKIIQALISFLLSASIQQIIFDSEAICGVSVIWIIFSSLALTILCIYLRKSSSNME